MNKYAQHSKANLYQALAERKMRHRNSAKSCMRKVKYELEEQANTKIGLIQRERPGFLRAYLCNNCHKYHITSKPLRESNKKVDKAEESVSCEHEQTSQIPLP